MTNEIIENDASTDIAITDDIAARLTRMRQTLDSLEKKNEIR